MKRNLFLSPLLFVSIITMLTSCEVDNVDAPDGTLAGNVIDKVTGKPIVSEPKGFRIELDETSWGDAALRHINVKPDGTYNNQRIPAATYKVTPVDGPFITPEGQTVEVKSGKTTMVDFTVTPYISFRDVSIMKEGTNVKVTFTLLKNVDSAVPRDYRVLVSGKTPNVGVVENAFDSEYSTAEIALNDDDFGSSKVVELDKLDAGKMYYIRIAARCDNPTGRYNFTEIVKIQM